MDSKQKSEINYFFVHVFNQILSWEEHSFKEMGFSDLSLRELHVIEAVCNLKETKRNRMSSIASYLSITPGSLTTAVNTLVKKGYLERENVPEDRRVVLIVPTDKAILVNETHSKFHSEMIDAVGELTNEKEVEVLVETLGKLSNFFENKSNIGGRK